MKNILAENLLRFRAKNVSESDLIKLFEAATTVPPLVKRIVFPSGKWSAAGGNVDALLQPNLEEMKTWLSTNKGYIIDVVLSASESYVPNRNGEVTPPTLLAAKELSKMRLATLKTYITGWLTGLQKNGVISKMPEIISKEPVTQGPKWAPPAGSTPAQISTLANSQQYTNYQYCEVTLKVLQDNIELPFGQVKLATNRSKYAAITPFNKTIFYNWSYAAAAVKGGGLLSDGRKLPGSLLTMNREIILTTPIDDPKFPNFKLPQFTTTIVPSGGETYKVICEGSGTGTEVLTVPFDSRKWVAWDAFIAPKYTLRIPFKEGTPEHKNAWLWLFWYIKTNHAPDWDYIDAPQFINFREELPSISAKADMTPSQVATLQQTMWSKTGLTNPDGTGANATTGKWYANAVKKFYGATSNAQGKIPTATTTTAKPTTTTTTAKPKP